MEVHLKTGIDKLVFGMKQADVAALYGKPDKKFEDEEQNIIFVYNSPMLRLTFYEDENLKLGYVISANPDLSLFGIKLINGNPAEIKAALAEKGIKGWEVEDFDLAENHFNESNWIILQSEFGRVAKVELGAFINDKDEFEWKFKK